MNEVSVSLRAAYQGCPMTNCDVINIRNIITSEGTIYWIREIKRSPDTIKAAAILVGQVNSVIWDNMIWDSNHVKKIPSFQSFN